MTEKEKEADLRRRLEQIDAWLQEHQDAWRGLPLDRIFTTRMSKRDPLYHYPERRLFRDFPKEAQRLVMITEHLRACGLIRIRGSRLAAEWILQQIYQFWIFEGFEGLPKRERNRT